MTLREYLLETLISAVMISIKIKQDNILQYNYWNWLETCNQLHLLDDDYKICHILYDDSLVEKNSDGSILVKSQNNPKEFIMNIFLGGVSDEINSSNKQLPL